MIFDTEPFNVSAFVHNVDAIIIAVYSVIKVLEHLGIEPGTSSPTRAIVNVLSADPVLQIGDTSHDFYRYYGAKL